jgi:hypothetical protein
VGFVRIAPGFSLWVNKAQPHTELVLPIKSEARYQLALQQFVTIESSFSQFSQLMKLHSQFALHLKNQPVPCLGLVALTLPIDFCPLIQISST